MTYLAVILAFILGAIIGGVCVNIFYGIGLKAIDKEYRLIKK